MKLLLFARGVLGFLGLYGTFYSLAHLPIHLAMMIVGATPLLVIFFGAMFLGETMKLEIILYAAGVVLAIYLVTHPSTPNETQPAMQIAPVLVAAGSSVATALAFITVRVAVNEVGAPSVVFWFAGCSTIGGALLGGLHWRIEVQWAAIRIRRNSGRAERVDRV